MRRTAFVVMVLVGATAWGAEPLTRERILATAAAFAEHEWFCSADNVTGGLACEPRWVCDWEPDQTYIGLPYDWGGYVSVAQFDQDLADGLGAGSHDLWPPLDCTTGVDCSGYVSQVWEVSHQNTYSMENVAHAIDPDDMLPGDAWNKPHKHIVLWVRQAENGAPVFYEAVGTPTSKVRLNEEADWSYLEGYSAIRVDKLEAAPPLTLGTLSNPIEIEAFPFVDDNNTDLSTSRLWNAYACAPDTNESGAEIFYRFTISRAGALHVVVTDVQGVDIDPHLLATADPTACLARHDTQFTRDLQPGTYWLTADTWVDSDGLEYPGPYHLEATFTPVGGADIDDPDGTTDSDRIAEEADAAGSTPDTDAGGGGCFFSATAAVGFGEAMVVFTLVLTLGLFVRLWRRRRSR